MLEQLLKTLFGGTIDAIVQAATKAPEPQPEPLPTQGIRMMMLTRAKEVNPDEWVIDIGSCQLYFNRYSWESARGAGLSFQQMLEKVEDKTWELLWWMCGQPNVEKIEISSLWRPWAGVHTQGLGVDLGAIKFTSGRVYIYRQGNARDFRDLADFRIALWDTGRVSQIIDPWKTNGVLGHAPGWRDNRGIEAIDIQHRDHMHISVRG